jgi:hypothetical protein
MRSCLSLLVAGLAAVPALADKKLDPDPAFLVKARTAATATVEPHYDLVSDKVPFWARFVICSGQLTAIRDEGRALPASKDEFDKLIADYRARAADLLAYRAKADPKASALDADAEIAKVRSGAMQFLPGDVTKIGVETMKKRATERLTFCQLTRDWYEVQNGIRTATSPEDQKKFGQLEAAERAKEKAAAAAIAPKPPILSPTTVQPIAPTAPPQPPVPTAVIVLPAGTPVGGDNARDHRVGSEVAHADARAEFSGRALWSAMAECSARMALIQARTSDNTKQQQDGYAARAAYVMAANRSEPGAMNLNAAASPVAQERARLAPRVAALWDEYRQRKGTIPNAYWGQVCGGLETYAHNYASKISDARDRVYQEKLKQYQQEQARQRAQQQQQPASSGSSGGYSGSSYGSSSSGSLDAAASRSRSDHQATMQRYERENRQIRQEIRAIDRKYGR